MYLFGIEREELLEFLPRDSVVAEIGVFKGHFSREILDRANPREFHMIDPWEEQDRAFYADNSNVEQEQFDTIFESVRARFADEVQSGQARLHRTYSQDVVDNFPDKTFDWVYIDGLHTYDGCLQDLRLYAPKVKDDGFLVGHDYANHPQAQIDNFQVVEAVNDFVRESGYTFGLLTNELYATYLIAKTEDPGRYNELILNMILQCELHAEIKNAETKTFQQFVAAFPNGEQRLVTSFD